jgi:hypothetical protein
MRARSKSTSSVNKVSACFVTLLMLLSAAHAALARAPLQIRTTAGRGQTTVTLELPRDLNPSSLLVSSMASTSARDSARRSATLRTASQRTRQLLRQLDLHGAGVRSPHARAQDRFAGGVAAVLWKRGRPQGIFTEIAKRRSGHCGNELRQEYRSGSRYQRGAAMEPARINNLRS